MILCLGLTNDKESFQDILPSTLGAQLDVNQPILTLEISTMEMPQMRPAETQLMEPPTMLTPLKSRRKSMEATFLGRKKKALGAGPESCWQIFLYFSNRWPAF